jgi:TPR repeat protein
LHDKLLDALPEERSKALAALVAAADEGSSAAAAELGFLYFHGSSGLPADPAKAQAYLRIGAEAGDADSANDLGVMFNEGLGVEQNYDTAAKFFQQAADGGHAKAQAVLGVAYAVGNGVPRDLVQAFKWMRLSALQGEAMGKNALADFVRGLSKEQITAGHKLVAEFLRGRGQAVSIEQLNQEILNPPPPPTLQELMPKLSPGQVVPANPASTPKR